MHPEGFKTNGNMNIFLVLDLFIGLPFQENYRCSRAYPVDPITLDAIVQILKAPRYWDFARAYFTEPESISIKSIKNPPEYHDHVGDFILFHCLLIFHLRPNSIDLLFLGSSCTFII